MGSAKKVSPSLGPQVIVKNRAWYYESKRGIELITQKRDVRGTLVSSAITRIPWSRLMKSAARCGWKVQKVKPRKAQ